MGNVGESYKHNAEEKIQDTIEYKETVSIFFKKTGHTKPWIWRWLLWLGKIL